jgi:hypothetical protein
VTAVWALATEGWVPAGNGAAVTVMEAAVPINRLRRDISRSLGLCISCSILVSDGAVCPSIMEK